MIFLITRESFSQRSVHLTWISTVAGVFYSQKPKGKTTIQTTGTLVYQSTPAVALASQGNFSSSCLSSFYRTTKTTEFQRWIEGENLVSITYSNELC